jgi:predicted transcriptional regulator
LTSPLELTHLNFAALFYYLIEAFFLNDEQIRILKTMNEATNRMDINMFAQAVNLEPAQAISDVQELAHKGFLRKVGAGYGLTEKGKTALNLAINIPSEKSFQLYVDIDKPLGFSAQSLEEFYRLLRQVTSDSLEFHLYRGDFENWLAQVLDDSELAAEVSGFKASELHGEDLRKALLKALDARYGVAELL